MAGALASGFSGKREALIEEMQRLMVGLPQRASVVQVERTLEAAQRALGGQTWFVGVPEGEGTRLLAVLGPTPGIREGGLISAERGDLHVVDFEEPGFDAVRVGLERSSPLTSEERELIDSVTVQVAVTLSMYGRVAGRIASLEKIILTAGDDLLGTIVREVARLQSVRCAFLTTTQPSSPGAVSIVAGWDAEGEVPRVSYEVAGTPCEAVFRDGLSAQALSGKEFEKIDGNPFSCFQAYAGLALQSSDGRSLGHLVLMDDEPFDDDRNPEGLLVMVRAPVAASIERRQMEGARQRSEERLSLALEAATIGVSDTDLVTGEMFIDDRSKALYGYTAEELRARGQVDILIHPEDRDLPTKAIAQHLEDGTDGFSVEHRMVHKNGTVHWTYAKGKVLRDDAGAPWRIITAGIDITDRKWREDVIANLAKAVLSDAEGDVFEGLAVHVSRALDVEAVAIVDFSDRGSKVRTRAVVRRGEVQPEREFLRSKYGGVIPQGAIRFGHEMVEEFAPHFRVFGDDTPAQLIGVPLVDESEELLGFLLASESGEHDRDRFVEHVLEIVASRAVSELRREREEAARKELEAKVQHAQKLESLGVLAGGIAHDFNNLLTAVLGNAGLALGSLPEGAAARGRVLQIELAARRAAELTEQMLAYSGRGSLEVRALDVNVVVREMADLLATVVSKKAQVTIDCGIGIGSVQADPSQVRQIVMNLITNASDAFEGGVGAIHVQTDVARELPSGLVHSWADAADAYVVVAVSDTGCGMDEATLEQVFDPFFTTKFTGRGLGMAAVIGIVRQHRGAIEIDSKPGRGTTVRVYFPRVAEEGVAMDSTGSTGTDSRLALVVDDEDMVRELLCASLEDAGFTPLSAGTGDEAKKLFSENRDDIGVVLLDLSMPDIGAGELYDALSAEDSRAKYILVSGYPEAEAREVFGREGLSAFLQKPFRIDTLVDLVESVVRS